jgi:hypothetical protein
MFSVEKRALNCNIFCKVCITETILPQFCKKNCVSIVPCKIIIDKTVEKFSQDRFRTGAEKKTYFNCGEYQILALEYNNLQKICAWVGCSKWDV